MSISHALWEANADLARACLDHPFVRGIADGSLPRERFAAYVGQDAFFLDAFARAYAIAAAKAPDREGFRAFHELAGGVLDELRLHEGYAASWGVDLHTVTPTAATRRYTDFLMATAWGGDVGQTAAAMTPCMRLYAYLGAELARGGVADHDYADWIRTYSSEEFERLARQLEALVDRYAGQAPAIPATYRYALECELGFFDSAGKGDA
jgi:thiaminase/transcriptional activator TenA